MRKKYVHNEYGEAELFWDNSWRESLSNGGEALNVNLRLGREMLRHLPPNARVLEGGCGNCHYVRFLHDRGFQVIGVDFARKTVERATQRWPQLDIREGNIRHLDFSDGSFDAYYSGGVIEHFEDGLTPQLTEARRVLKPNGLFFVTVPHISFARWIQGKLSKQGYYVDLDDRRCFRRENVSSFIVEPPPENYHFHEYALETKELKTALSACGFAVVKTVPFSIRWGLADLPWTRQLRFAPSKPNRHLGNFAYRALLKIGDLIEERDKPAFRSLCNVCGALVANLQLYVCRAVK
jgi:SAM-dependent methyltransferase